MSHKANYWLAGIAPHRVKSGAFRVLFHLCDHHRDDKDPMVACFPSQETLRERTGLSNGALNDALAAMEDEGLLVRRRSTVPGSSERRTYYILGCDMDGDTKLTPDFGVSPNSGGPEAAQKQTPVLGQANSGFGRGKLRCTGEEPVITGKGTGKDKNKGADEALMVLSQFASPEAAASFVAYRRKSKGGALTATAAKRLSSTLTAIASAGHDPDDALGMAEERGWLTVKLDWYLREKSNDQHRSSSNLRSEPAHLRQNRPDPALENIARIVGLGSAQGHGRC